MLQDDHSNKAWDRFTQTQIWAEQVSFSYTACFLQLVTTTKGYLREEEAYLVNYKKVKILDDTLRETKVSSKEAKILENIFTRFLFNFFRF